MADVFKVEWNSNSESFVIHSDDGPASLPTIPPHLDADLDAWEQHLRDHFIPDRYHYFSGGQWASEEARWWFVSEARRIERELMKAVPRSRGVILVSAYPGVILIGFHNDYGNWPLWTIGGGTGPEDFPMLSERLRDDLIAWSERHETGDSHTEGHGELLRRLQDELGPLYEVE